MILSDNDIVREVENGNLVIEPFDEAYVQPASIDMRLDTKFIAWGVEPGTSRQPAKDGTALRLDKYIIKPGEFILAQTLERVSLPGNIAGRIEGKSSWGRRGLTVHITAGFIDPGFIGNLTLEMCNLSKRPIEITAGEKICQVSFMYLNTPVNRLYGHPDLGSHYQGQIVPMQAESVSSMSEQPAQEEGELPTEGHTPMERAFLTHIKRLEAALKQAREEHGL